MGTIRTLRLAILLTILAIVGILSVLLSMASSSYEITRMRNSLIADIGSHDEFGWSPDSPPEGFLLEKSPTPSEFIAVVQTILEPHDKTQSNWDKALAIVRHLNQGTGLGGGIMSDTYDTYQKIITEKRGYCADYTQVFNGIAIAADIPVREWGMSFDGFSGYGHAFNEIYDEGLDKWIFVDSFYSFYVEDKDSSVPLSALELRERLRAGATENELTVKPIAPHRFGFKDAQRTLEYYRRGADQFFLWFGNNVFSYDNHFIVRVVGPISRALEQGAGILLGIHPRFRIIKTQTNGDLIDALFWKRNLFIGGLILLVVLTVALILEIRAYRRTRLNL